jgi:hypothetical protein
MEMGEPIITEPGSPAMKISLQTQAVGVAYNLLKRSSFYSPIFDLALNVSSALTPASADYLNPRQLRIGWSTEN